MLPKRDVLLSTVRIVGVFSPDKEMTLGTGFALHRDEQQSSTYIVTCAHVIEAETNKGRAEKIRVDSFYGKRDAEIISLGLRTDLDLAILAVKDLKSLPLLSPSNQMIENMPVKIPGTQLITDAKIPKTETLEGHLGKAIRLAGWRESWIIEQLDRKELQGYSGSPAIDPHDHVFGIVSTEQGEGCIALSLSALKDLPIKDDEQKHTSLIQFISQLPDNITSTSERRGEGKQPVMGTPSSSSGTAHAIEIFFSYADEDKDMAEKLQKHLVVLKRQGLITDWSSAKLEPGKDPSVETMNHLNSAKIILLLISSDYLFSEYHDSVEVKRAMERSKAGKATVIPVLLAPTDDLDSTPFGKLLALPRNRKPISLWTNTDLAFAEVAKEIRAVVNSLKL